MIVLAALIAALLFIFALTALLNALTFPRIGTRSVSQSDDLISVLIPARNEAEVISATLERLIAQDYAHFEIIVLDDNSIDGTAEAARAAAADFPHFRVVSGKPLPEGWLGKNWACHQLAEAASGDWLLFTDADVEWRPGALSSLMTTQTHHNTDMLTVWPTQITKSWAERLVVPLMIFAIYAYLPEIMVRRSKLVAFAAANGQCLLFKRDAYAKIGGHTAVRGNITEDVAMARNIKRHGLKLVMADGFGKVACRMYHNWASVRDGFGKNILAGHGDSVPFLLFSTVFHWTLFVLPWVWALLALFMGNNVLIPLALGLVGVGIRGLTAFVTRQRVVDAVFMPISVLLMTRIALQALWWRYRYGGPQWKGRTIVTQKS
jgi:chlorobactene glucosyltransferase